MQLTFVHHIPTHASLTQFLISMQSRTQLCIIGQLLGTRASVTAVQYWWTLHIRHTAACYANSPKIERLVQPMNNQLAAL